MQTILNDTVISKVESTNYVVKNSAVLTITGILNGDIILEESSKLILTGIINGDIHIDKTSHAVITGIVNAKSIVNEGTLDLTGIITYKKLSGSISPKEGSYINGIKQ